MNRLRASFLNLKERLFGFRLTKAEIFLFAAIAFFFFINATYVAYPDEFVNLLGGRSINQGKLPYKEFFDHHLPLAWYLSAGLLKLAFNNFVLFRYLWAGFAFALLAFLGLWIRSNHRELFHYYLAFFFIYPLMAVYFWFHLYLADSLAVLFFSVAFWLLASQTITKRIRFQTIVLTSLATFALIFSSLTFLFLAAALYLWQFYLVGWKKWLHLFFWIVAPYLLYLIYLLLTGTFSDFYFANLTYNTELYISIPNYSNGRFFNPLKLGLTLIHNFYQGYLPLLSKIRFLDLYLPIGVLSGAGTLLLLLFWSLESWFIGLIFFLILSFSAPRSDIQSYKETDYQSAMFLVLGVASSLVALYLLQRYRTKSEILNDVRRVGQFLLALFFFFTLIFLLSNTFSKFFQRYTQKLPGIRNQAFMAQFVDSLIDEGDSFWIGPYEPHNEFFVRKGRLPGKYPTLLPQFRENEYLQQSFLEQFEKDPPVVIVYIHAASIFQTPALEFGKFFVDWIEPRYSPLERIRGTRTIGSPTDFHLTTDLYIRNDKIEEVLPKIRATGYLK